MTDRAATNTKFSVLCSLFTWIQRGKTAAKKRSKFRRFLDTFCHPVDYFSAIRLIIPNLDRERGTYGLKESVLATCLIDALGMSRDSPDALRLVNWRKGGSHSGANVGNFSLVAAEVLQRRQGMASGGLTIKDVNDLLDRLASSENRAEKTSILSTLINKTNAEEMKWIIMIILKDLKLGISEKSIFHEFHPDAEDLFNVTCDLKLVCEKLRNRSQRHKRQDIEVGKAVRPQLAMRVADATAAWKKLHGKEVVVECKFDGDRIQIHKNGTDIHYFSRNFLDHSEYGPGTSDFIIQNVLVDRCILDGEMLVWDTSLNRFAEFGSNQEIAKAAKDGLDNDRQERHELLRKVVRPLKGRLEILVPNGGFGLNTLCPSGEPCWSLIAHNVDDVERFFRETIENRDEGVIIKDLGSKWEPGDRSGKWLKLKPDYIRAGSDLDVLIIGGYYGSGRHGGEVAQFLVGLAECPAPDTFPRRFISFCRVGAGLSDGELDAVATKLKPYFRSILLSITSDIRTIRSEVFAAPYSLRFPRIDRVRNDKPWHECLDVQYFVNVPPILSLDSLHKMVAENGGTFSMNLNNSVTHCVAADTKGIKYQAAKLRGDIIHYSWLLDCCSQKKLLHLQPKYFLFLSDSSKKKLLKEIDEFSDSYYQDIDLADIKQLLSNVNRTEDTKIIDHYKKKYCPKTKWSLFHGCCFYFHPSIPSLNPDWEVLLGLALRRLKVEVSMAGGKVCSSLDLATHLVFFSVPGFDVDLGIVLKSLTSDKYLLWNKGLHVVRSQWLEDCLERNQRLQEETYSLKAIGVHDSNTVEGQHDKHELDRRALSAVDNEEKQNKSSPDIDKPGTERTALGKPKILASYKGVGKRKRGRPAGTTALKIGKPDYRPNARRTRARIGKRAANEYLIMNQMRVDHTRRGHIWMLSTKFFIQHDKHELDRRALSAVDNEEKQNKSSPDIDKPGTERTALGKPKILASYKGVGKRKRGRPAGTSMKIGKPTIAQARRTRARIGKRAAKISDNESDESGSHKERTQGEEIKMKEGNHEMTGEAAEIEVEDVRSEERSYKIPKAEVTNSQDSKRPKKLEVMTDPVQAMLLDMIPSLGVKGIGIPTTILEDEKPPLDPNAEPEKKRKVSYKDVAGELLKDW
ncbi:putative DNA ligase 4 [Morella rubra]|uniref:DNA ligase IV n=1 Tax=Morella rubra TaxID=262757 RepID=A0A6A1UID8_9ROSI|nr:putative DNA ligase 4 [Morella rubra]